MAVPRARLDVLIDRELARVVDPARRATLAGLLVAPELRRIGWDYGEPASLDCWILTAPVRGVALAYCDAGFGPGDPWGCPSLDHDSMGMDARWHSGLEEAAIHGRWLTAPPGYQVPGPRDPRGELFGGDGRRSRLISLCALFEARLADLDHVRELARVGEAAVALHALVSRFIDADAPVALTLAELAHVAELGDALGCRADWAALIACLPEVDRATARAW